MSAYTGEKGQEYYDMRAARRTNFLQKRRASHFQPFVKPTDVVLDFGCGTGGVLSNLECQKKIGIEVNEPSANEAREAGLDVFGGFQDIEDNSIDIVISNHALEHVLDPAYQVKEINRVLKSGGKAILVVPAESPSFYRFSKWKKNDPDRHIFSWTPLSFGNLISQCGFGVEKSYRRPIGYSKYIEFLADKNESAFQIARRIVAFLLQRYEIVCIAQKS